MGGRGPRPEPTTTKQAKGTYRADRACKNEPETDGCLPSCPSWMRSTARGKWRRLTVELAGKGLLDSTDGSLLTLYCETWARWVAVSKDIQRHGETYEVETKNGCRQYVRPEVRTEHDLSNTLRQLSAEFGMSPAARSRVTSSKKQKPKSDDKAKFFAPKIAKLG